MTRDIAPGTDLPGPAVGTWTWVVYLGKPAASNETLFLADDQLGRTSLLGSQIVIRDGSSARPGPQTFPTSARTLPVSGELDRRLA